MTDAVPLSQSDVEAERVRARRRLIGMVVLVGAGVIGFPWLFETQPRPMSSEIQVVQAPTVVGAGDASASRPAGGASRSVAGKVAVAGIVEAPPLPVAVPVPTEAPPPAREPADEVSKPAVVKPVVKEQPKAQAKDTGKTASKDVPSKPAAKPVDKGADKATTRYVVQFGAFADSNAAQAARMKVERLGIKTYAQQVDTPAGKRIRVRVGPYTDKTEADKAMATVRKAGLVGAVLTL